VIEMQMWSLNNNKSPYIGRAYFKRKTTSIFILKTLRECIWYSDNAKEAYTFFIREIIRTEFHEFMHIFFYHELKKWSCSEKTKFEPLEVMITPYLGEVLADSYAELFYEVFEWLKEKVKWV